MNQLKKLFEIVGQEKKAFYIVIFSVVISFIELIGLALIIPYISLAISQEIPNNEYINLIVLYLNISSFKGFMFYVTVGILIFYIIRFITNIIYIHISIKFITNIRHILVSKLFTHYAYIDYNHFVYKNTSELKKTLLIESVNTQNILKSMKDIISEVFVLLLILAIIFYTNWQLSLFLFALFTLIFLFISRLLKTKINQIANERKIFNREMVKNVDETLNNYKFTKLIGAEQLKIDSFINNSYGVYKVNSMYQILNQIPRFILETTGLIVIVLIIYFLIPNNSSEQIIVTIGIYAIAFYRALPSINRIVTSYNGLQFYKNTIDQIYDEFLVKKEEKCSKSEKLEFNNSLTLENINFKYKKSNDLLFKNLNLIIKKGESIAFTGESGSGKSTLVDIIMGILNPVSGNILIDTKIVGDNLPNLRNKFGYIPQDIYLFDASVADNIVFGREYDEEKIIEVLKKANIYEYLLTKDGIETNVGEGGIQLSGGQKQRIGIARALYNNPEILVLDEATSALDNKTEEKIMDEIYSISNDKTLIIIAHRLSTIEKCNKIYKLENGKLILKDHT